MMARTSTSRGVLDMTVELVAKIQKQGKDKDDPNNSLRAEFIFFIDEVECINSRSIVELQILDFRFYKFMLHENLEPRNDFVTKSWFSG